MPPLGVEENPGRPSGKIPFVQKLGEVVDEVRASGRRDAPELALPGLLEPDVRGGGQTGQDVPSQPQAGGLLEVVFLPAQDGTPGLVADDPDLGPLRLETFERFRGARKGGGVLDGLAVDVPLEAGPELLLPPALR